MNAHLQELVGQAKFMAEESINKKISASDELNAFAEMFAKLIVQGCLNIAKNREDELENGNLLKESNAVGIVVYRIVRQFGGKE